MTFKIFTIDRCQHRVWALAGLLAASVSVSMPCSGQEVESSTSLGPVDVARIRQACLVSRLLGDELWPGFDLNTIAIAVNHQDRQEMLIGHDAPDDDFRPFGEHEVFGRDVLIRDEVTFSAPNSGGWTRKINGIETVYVGTFDPQKKNLEEYVLLLLHEGFHVFSLAEFERPKGEYRLLSEDDPFPASMIGLESRILHAAVAAADEAALRELAGMFVAVRRTWWGDLPESVQRTEAERMFLEGLACFVEVHALELLAERGGLDGSAEPLDPHDKGFRTARALLEERYQAILPSPGEMVKPIHAHYQFGMAQCVLLDRLRPGWKREISAPFAHQFMLLERVFPPDADVDAALVNDARDRFGYEAILTEQTTLVEQRLDLIRGYLHAPGRRYLVNHGAIRARFKSDKDGPLYRVPPVLLDDPDEYLSIWVGGIPWFEKAGLEFRSVQTPIMFRMESLEWIDPEPATDGSDFVIEFDQHEGDVYVGLRLKTDGFTLTASRARIIETDELVEIQVLPESP